MVELPSLADQDFFSLLRTNAEVPLEVTHGTVPGNIIQLSAALMQVTDIELGEQNNVLEATISFGLNVGNTNNDLVITAR